MTEYSNAMTNCMGQISQLSSTELVNFAEAVAKEQKAKANRECKEQILATIIAIDRLYNYYDYLEIEYEGILRNIYLTDISKALEQLYSDC